MNQKKKKILFEQLYKINDLLTTGNELPVLETQDHDDLLDELILNINKIIMSYNHGIQKSQKKMNELVDVIASISSLNFSKKATISDDLDIFDALAVGLNNLGEEIKNSTVSRDYLDSIIQSIQDMIVVTDEKIKVKTVNRAFLDLMEIDANDILQLDLITFLEHESFNSLFSASGDVKVQKDIIMNFVTQKGIKIPVSLNVSMLKLEEGTTHSYVFVARDLREKIKNDELRTKTEYRYKQFYDNMRDGFASADMSGNLMEFNNTFKFMLGYSEEALRNKTVKDITPVRWHHMEEKIREEVRKRGYSDIYEKEYIKADGDILPVEMRTYMIHDSQGKPSGMWAFVRDISERKNILRELNESRDRLSEAQRIARLGNWDWNIITGDVYWSDEIYRMFGLQPQEIPADYQAFLSIIHPDDRQNVVDAVNGAVAGKQSYSIDHRLVVKDGSTCFVHEQGQVYYDADGRPLRMIGTVQDITDHKIYEEKLQLRQEEIERLNGELKRKVDEELLKSREKDHILIQQSRLAAMGEMISHIAHQWRQPLNALNLLITNLLYSWKFNELDDAYLQQFKLKSDTYIKKMSSTIDDFRNFFSPMKNKSIFKINDVIRQTLDLIEPTYRHYGIRTEIKDTIGIEVFGFPNEFSQVLLNLLNNSKDALVENKITDAWVRVETAKKGDFGVLVITDNGGGIPKSVISKVFDPYFSTKEEGKGTGIGLYMSKMIVEDHMKGKISVVNNNGGAEFEILVPLSLDVESK